MRYDNKTTLVIFINLLFIVILISTVLHVEFTEEALM